MLLPAEKGRFTFADVLHWDKNDRAEIITGEVFMVAPRCWTWRTKLLRRWMIQKKKLKSIKIPKIRGNVHNLFTGST